MDTAMAVQLARGCSVQTIFCTEIVSERGAELNGKMQTPKTQSGSPAFALVKEQVCSLMNQGYGR